MMAETIDIEPPATLLVVDDDVGIRSLLATNLGSRGYRVVTAQNASEMRMIASR